MEIIRHIKVDLYGDTQHFAVAAKQMDMGTRYIGVTLMEDGVVYEIPDNVEVIINMTKPDKEISQVLTAHVTGSVCNRYQIFKCIPVKFKNRVCFYPIFRRVSVIVFVHLCDIHKLTVVLENALE